MAGERNPITDGIAPIAEVGDDEDAFLTAKTADNIRAVRRVLDDGDTPLPGIADSTVFIARVGGDASSLSPFELFVMRSCNGQRPVARVRQKMGISHHDIEMALRLLLDKGLIAPVGIAERAQMNTSVSGTGVSSMSSSSSGEAADSSPRLPWTMTPTPGAVPAPMVAPLPSLDAETRVAVLAEIPREALRPERARPDVARGPVEPTPSVLPVADHRPVDLPVDLPVESADDVDTAAFNEPSLPSFDVERHAVAAPAEPGGRRDVDDEPPRDDGPPPGDATGVWIPPAGVVLHGLKPHGDDAAAQRRPPPTLAAAPVALLSDDEGIEPIELTMASFDDPGAPPAAIAPTTAPVSLADPVAAPAWTPADAAAPRETRAPSRMRPAPEEAAHLARRADSLVDKGDHAGAVTLLRVALDKDPSSASLRHRLGVLLAAYLADLGGAIVVLRRAVVLAPDDVRIAADLARVHVLLDNTAGSDDGEPLDSGTKSRLLAQLLSSAKAASS